MAQTEFLGIDIGTSTIEIARFIHSQNRVEMVKFDDGNYYYPMYYARANLSGKETFGNKAKEYLANKNQTVCYEIKRLIGKRYDDPDVQKELKQLTFKTTKLPDGSVGIVFTIKKKDVIMTPLEIYERILLDVMAHLDNSNIPHEYAVVCVPNDFGDIERNLIKQMFENPEGLAFKRVKLINEPTAAALDFGFSDNKVGKYAIFDYGGGTLDLSVVDCSKTNGKLKFKAIAYNGMRDNGGSDIDRLLMEHVMKELAFYR